MASNRIQRTNEDIKHRLSELLRQVKDPRVNQGMISVIAVETTNDLSHCKVYVSVLGLQSEKDFMRGMKSASGWLRRELGASLKLRHVPELHFSLDRSLEHGAHINSILSELDIQETRENKADDST
jgi:ribosome-binding factor A